MLIHEKEERFNNYAEDLAQLKNAITLEYLSAV